MTSIPSTTLPHESGDYANEPDFLSPFLFLVIQSTQPFAPSVRCPLKGVDEVRIGRRGSRCIAAVNDGGRQFIEMGLADPTISLHHARIFHDEGRWVLKDAGSKNGTLVNGDDRTTCVLQDGDVLEIGTCFFIFRAEMRARASEYRIVDSTELGDIPGFRSLHPQLAFGFRDASRFAKSRLPILILGPTGAGKEVMARAIHSGSGRTGRFVATNCGALTSTLLQGELFGHTKGAFTGATKDRLGLIRSADQGTLFLDEVGDLSVAGQVALLRALEEGEVTPVGSASPISVDFRIVAATNRNLDIMVARGQMRSDFLARVAACKTTLPPLLERREDFGLLLSTVLKPIVKQRDDKMVFSAGAIRALLNHHWPLNIRELRQTVERGLTLCDGKVLSASHFALDDEPEPLPESFGESPLDEPMTQPQLEMMLTEHGGNISAVARALAKDPQQIRRWMRRFRLRRDDYSKPA